MKKSIADRNCSATKIGSVDFYFKQEESVKKLFGALDEDGNGYVKLDEFTDHLVTQV